jgi:hypothetical protein
VFLADVLGWNGLFIESSGEDYRALESKYSGSPGVTTLNARVTAENIEDLLFAQSVPTEPDVLSIDVDGQDYWIWEAVERYRPRILLVEYNSSVPYGRPLTQPSDYGELWDGTDYFGASLAAFERLAQAKNYVLVHTELAAINAFFVRAELACGCFPEHEQVPRRSAPNYYLRGIHHPADPRHRGYLDLETGEVVVP